MGSEMCIRDRVATPATAPTIIVQAVADIATGIAELAASGLDDFLVFNLPSLGSLPGIVGTPAEPVAEGLTRSFNDALAAALAPLSAIASIEVFDTFSWFERFIAQAEAGGLVIDEACLALGSTCDPSNATTHINWDGLHPTEFVHQALADRIEANIVPLPAGMVLLVTGFGALTVMRRRKQT